MIRKFAENISQKYKNLLPYTHLFKEWYWELKYLKFNNKRPEGNRLGIMRVDGRGTHGGMTDRFIGAVSWWNYCEKNNLKFKLYYTSPFKLFDYVIPNEYDWTIDESQIPDGIKNTRIFYGRGEKGYRLEKVKTKKHIWYYGNYDLSKTLHYFPYNRPWGEIFKKLFKPAPDLERLIDEHKNKIGVKYGAVHFRFQNLLGESTEPLYRKIENDRERNQLITTALKEIEKIHLEHPDQKVFVASDSNLFIKEASKKDYVYVLPGISMHMDYMNEDANRTQLKSFLDFFMISEASKVYSIVIGDMYESGLPQYAAKINNVPFERRLYRD